MINNPRSYSLFYKFIQTYSPDAFKSIDPADPSMIELEELMENNNQFFFIGDILQMKINYTSKRSIQLMGIVPEELTPYHFREGVHPDDALRQGLGTAQLFKIANQLFLEKEGSGLLSTNLRFRNSTGYYSNLLLQCFLFYSDSPVRTVYILQIHTGIESAKMIKHGYHYYVGKDLAFFRYPDEELLSVGNPLTHREFEIINLIAAGMSSEQIAEKIFLSFHTISTHRSDILEKTGFNTIADLIFDFQKRGLM
jgi:DNA-binding CsgD family transcriptional regulator